MYLVEITYTMYNDDEHSRDEFKSIFTEKSSAFELSERTMIPPILTDDAIMENDNISLDFKPSGSDQSISFYMRINEVDVIDNARQVQEDNDSGE